MRCKNDTDITGATSICGEYKLNANGVYRREADGSERWYDENKRLIHAKTKDKEDFYEYYPNGKKKTSHEMHDGIESWAEYYIHDSRGAQKFHTKYPDGQEFFVEYGKHGRYMRIKHIHDGITQKTNYRYGVKVSASVVNRNGDREYFEYYPNGNVKTYRLKCMLGYTVHCEYDEEKNLISREAKEWKGGKLH